MNIAEQPSFEGKANRPSSSSLVGPILRNWQRLYRGTPNFRGKGRILFEWPSRLIRKSPSDVAITSNDGSIFLHCDLNEYLYRALFIFGLHEVDVDWMCGRILRPGDILVDIGACYGYHALTNARRVGPQGRVIAFEPQPDMFAVLNENVCHNGLENIQTNNLALSDQTEQIQLYYFSDLGVGHTSIAHLKHAVSGILKCSAITLDEYIAINEIPYVTLVKLDVEGAELNVIKGTRKLLCSSKPPMWILEVNMTTAEACGYHPQDLLSLLGDYGYKAFKPIWSKASGKVLHMEICPINAIEHGQNLLCAIPRVHHAALSRLGLKNQS
jgi:FkbM family methyltransferase